MKPGFVLALCTSLACLSGATLAAPGLSLSLAEATTEPVKFAASKIRREAAARGLTVLKAGDPASAATIAITLDLAAPAEKPASPQSYSIRVGEENGHRYNVISLWSLHPFPSIVRVPEFPNVALDDVWRTRVKLDGKFDNNGNGFVRPDMLADHEIVKTMTIDQKTRFWQTYGEGIRDGLKDAPGRKFRLIHRFHMTGLQEELSHSKS